ncbi:MAG: protoporphyrinogen oxidase [Ilumatobacteraceae bacterium]
MSEQSATGRRVAVLGGGITGLTAAFRLASAGHQVTVFEADDRWGGKIHATPFAGLASVEAGPDAVLARVPWGKALMDELGIDDYVAPATGTAYVARGGQTYTIPDGLVLGVPAGWTGLARSGLLSWPGKFRAAMDVVRPRTSVEHDSLGQVIRDRFGAEVLELLVDPLVGSINAGDSDHLSLRAATPQIAPVAERSRSLLLGLRKVPRPPASSAPVFPVPLRRAVHRRRSARAAAHRTRCGPALGHSRVGADPERGATPSTRNRSTAWRCTPARPPRSCWRTWRPRSPGAGFVHVRRRRAW